LIVIVMSNGSVESQHLEFDQEVSETRLTAVTMHLQRSLVGRTLAGEVTVASSGEPQVDAICAKAVAAIRQIDNADPVFVGGASSMAASFEAVDVVRQVLQTLEQQYLVVTLVSDILNRGLSVAIGAEHGIEPLASCSVVVSPVVVDGQQVGTVGVLGPTRMDYPQALATVEVVSDRLGRRLGEG
jgi:heat-inducible transcriptional repressor